MPDVDANAINALLGAGMTQKSAAAELGVSEAKVSRVLRAGRAVGAGGAALAAVECVALSLSASTPDQRARIEAARALARKLDWSAEANTGAAAMATAALVREFRSVLDELREASSFDALRAALLADDG